MGLLTRAGNPYRRKRISTVDLLALASLAHLLIYFLTQTSYPKQEVNRNEPSHSVVSLARDEMEMLARDKHSSIVGPFVSYIENQVL